MILGLNDFKGLLFIPQSSTILTPSFPCSLPRSKVIVSVFTYSIYIPILFSLNYITDTHSYQSFSFSMPSFSICLVYRDSFFTIVDTFLKLYVNEF